MMKYNFLILMVIVFLAPSCKNKQKSAVPDEKAKSEISFESTVHDFGTIEQKSDGRCYFKFTNTSDVPLVVNMVRTTCGCTRPEWPRKPVAPGEKGEIGITYDTSTPGNFQKSITVYSNAENSPVKLMIKGKVAFATNQENTK